MLSVVPSIVVLGLVALVALGLARTRRPPPERQEERRAAARALALAAGVQAVHFAEEAATGLHAGLPALFGLPPMSFPLFVVFNLAWIAIWIVSVAGVRAASDGAFFAAWFLALAGMLNGIAHPLLAAAAQGYFPGLVSSPVIGGASVWLWLQLRRATRPGSARGALAGEADGGQPP